MTFRTSGTCMTTMLPQMAAPQACVADGSAAVLGHVPSHAPHPPTPTRYGHTLPLARAGCQHCATFDTVACGRRSAGEMPLSQQEMDAMLTMWMFVHPPKCVGRLGAWLCNVMLNRALTDNPPLRLPSCGKAADDPRSRTRRLEQCSGAHCDFSLVCAPVTRRCSCQFHQGWSRHAINNVVAADTLKRWRSNGTRWPRRCMG
jgi:hypothetical protein